MKHKPNTLKQRLKSLTQSRKARRHALVGSATLWQMKRDFQIQFLQAMNLKPEHYLLDIGCGTLRGGLPLIAYLQAEHYFGLEVRAEVLAQGRQELKEAGMAHKNPMLLLSTDMAQLTIHQPFDYIWAFSVLIHMDEATLNTTLDFVRRHLAEKGAFYANVNIGEETQGHWQGFPVVWKPFAYYQQACLDNGLTVSDIGKLKEHGHLSQVTAQDNQTMLKIARQ